jgi:hypothetical protein
MMWTWYAEREGKSLINFGQRRAHSDSDERDARSWSVLANGRCGAPRASSEELTKISEGIDHGLKRGALAVGMGINYTAAAS